MDRGDNYDDKEGYYAHRIGDILNERYKVAPASAPRRSALRPRRARRRTALRPSATGQPSDLRILHATRQVVGSFGKGVFSTVVRCVVRASAEPRGSAQ